MMRPKILCSALLFFIILIFAGYSWSATPPGDLNPAVSGSRDEAGISGHVNIDDRSASPLGGATGGMYVLEQNASDQGAVNAVGTLAYLVNHIGSGSATITINGPYVYTISTDVSVPKNINLVFNNGAVFSVSSGVTLTVFAPEQIQAGYTQQIKSGSGALTFARGGSISISWWGADGSSVSDSTTAIQGAINSLRNVGGRMTNHPVGRLIVPPGYYKVTSELTIDYDGLCIDGYGSRVSLIWVYHDGIAINYSTAKNDLATSRISINRLGIVNQQIYTKDNGYPSLSYQGTGLKLYNAHANQFSDLFISHFLYGIDLNASYFNTFDAYLGNYNYYDLYAHGGSNGNSFKGGVMRGACYPGTGQAFYSVDFEPSSTTHTIGSNNGYYNCRFERFHFKRDFFVWLYIKGDNNRFENCVYAWNGTTLPGSGENDYYFIVAGKGNYMDFGALYCHRKVLMLTTSSSRNQIIFKEDFDDYINTGKNNAYRSSNQFYFDLGVNNEVVVVSDISKTETIGTGVLKSAGNPNTYLRESVLSNLTMSKTKYAKSEINGPLGASAGNINVGKFICSSDGLMRIYADPDIKADGETDYCASAYIYIPKGSSIKSVGIAVAKGQNSYYLASYGTGRWVKISVYSRPAKGTNISWIIDCAAVSGQYFYVAFPSLSLGISPSFLDRKSSDTDNTIFYDTEFRNISVLKERFKDAGN